MFEAVAGKLDQFRREFEKLKHMDGDFAEFGVYNGGTSRELASLDPQRLVWAFDTFEGMLVEDYGGDMDRSDPPGKWKPDAQPEVLFASTPNVKAMKGRFVDTTPLVPADVRILIAHVDCDWYASYKQSLEFLMHHMVPGSVVLMDEPGYEGTSKAIKEWMALVGDKATWDGGARIVWNA